MICPRCGSTIPANRKTCINCGFKPDEEPIGESGTPGWKDGDPFKDMEIKKEEKVEENPIDPRDLGKGIIFLSSTFLLSLILAGMAYYLFFFLPWISLGIVYLVTVPSLIAIILLLSGFFRTGVVFGILSSIVLLITIPFAWIYLTRLLSWTEFAKKERKEGNKNWKKRDIIIRPKPLHIVICILSILILLMAPGAGFYIYHDRPLLYIVMYDAPDSYRSNTRIDIEVTVCNYGLEKAEEKDILIGIVTSGNEVKFNWTRGDIEGVSNGKMECKFEVQFSLDKIVLYYKGSEVDEKEITEMYLPTQL